MDGQRFDELTRGLATARSRRGVLKALTGSIVAGVGAVMAPRGVAIAQGSCASDADCAEDEICCAGTCRAIECCIDEADPNARCPEGTSCFEGICEPVDDDDDDDVTTLPETGVGPGSAGTTPPIGAILTAGAAAAALGARTLRKRADEAEEPSN